MTPDVAAYLEQVTSPKRRRDAETLVELMRRVTGEEARLWGSVVGFGQYHCRYASGREGDAAAAGFAARVGRTRHNAIVTVVGLQAWCDYVTEDEYRDTLAAFLPAPAIEEAVAHFRRGVSFRVREFAVLADGRRLTLSDDRGFAMNRFEHGVGSTAPADPWRFLTVERLESDVRTTVLPDDDTEEEHPWEWLAQRLRAHRVDASPEELKQLPYDVVLSERLRARVAAHTYDDRVPPQA